MGQHGPWSSSSSLAAVNIESISFFIACVCARRMHTYRTWCVCPLGDSVGTAMHAPCGLVLSGKRRLVYMQVYVSVVLINDCWMDSYLKKSTRGSKVQSPTVPITVSQQGLA